MGVRLFLLLQRSGGEVVNVSVRKTDIRGFESLSELKKKVVYSHPQIQNGYGTDVLLYNMLAWLIESRRLRYVQK